MRHERRKKPSTKARDIYSRSEAQIWAKEMEKKKKARKHQLLVTTDPALLKPFLKQFSGGESKGGHFSRILSLSSLLGLASSGLLKMPTSSRIFFFLLCSFISISLSIAGSGNQLIVVNNCNITVWPGILGGAGHPHPAKGGFRLGRGEEVVVNVPSGWSGRIWGRQGCCFDENGKGTCDTGDCGGLLHCMGTGGNPPATVVEMTLGTSKSALHYYDVSLVDGFNIPVSMLPVGGGIGCGVAACEVDLNFCCPSMLEVKRGGKVVACKSACLALKSAKYCCTGDYASPRSCKPSLYAHLFKAICPRAYSYAFDDSSSLHTCRSSRYLITFCPPPR